MVSTRSSSRPGDTPTSLSNSSTSRRTPSSTRKTRGGAATGWQHVPSFMTRVWLAISLPLVVWDTIYVLGRPLTMEGGWMHWPLWVPYKLYGEIDYVYGWRAVEAKSGFTSAQGTLNVFETVMYMVYLWMLYEQGAWGAGGRVGGKAALIGFSAAVMTLSKTVLYWANEYYSGFANIGHNAPMDLFFLWIIPNGAWLVGSTIMIFDIGASILDGLEAASGRSKRD